MDQNDFVVPPGVRVSLNEYDPASQAGLDEKTEAQEKLAEDTCRLAALQDRLYAAGKYAVLIILQGMDTSGKDSAIKHVMSGLNPQGVRVDSFRAPSEEDLSHDFLWRCVKRLPERGHIGIFNRSYYEEVLIVRVHPELLERQNLPPEVRTNAIWQHRYEDINAFERYLVRNGTIVVKFFLHLSKHEQKQRFLARIERPEKHWKFSQADLDGRDNWDAYMAAYEAMLTATSTRWAPWHVVPADRKWVARAVIAQTLASRLETLNLEYPTATAKQQAELRRARKLLHRE